MQTQFQLSSYIHACTNETHSLAYLQVLANLYIGQFVLLIFTPAKVGIKSCIFARECSFVRAWM